MKRARKGSRPKTYNPGAVSVEVDGRPLRGCFACGALPPPPPPPPVGHDPTILRGHIFQLGQRFGVETYGDPLKVIAWAQEEISRLREYIRTDHRDRTREVAAAADLVVRMAQLAERGDPSSFRPAE